MFCAHDPLEVISEIGSGSSASGVWSPGRAVQMLQPVVATLNMVPVYNSVDVRS
jgi:hypothetical protein